MVGSTIKLDGVEVSIETLEKHGFVRKEPKYWEPKEGTVYYYVTSEGDVTDITVGVEDSSLFHNIFQTRDQAKKAAEYMRRSNAIIRACLLVDPDFVSDWSDHTQAKWGVFYSHEINSWISGCSCVVNENPCKVSTKEKAEEVCRLLTEWGVK